MITFVYGKPDKGIYDDRFNTDIHDRRINYFGELSRWFSVPVIKCGQMTKWSTHCAGEVHYIQWWMINDRIKLVGLY